MKFYSMIHIPLLFFNYSYPILLLISNYSFRIILSHYSYCVILTSLIIYDYYISILIALFFFVIPNWGIP